VVFLTNTQSMHYAELQPLLIKPIHVGKRI